MTVKLFGVDITLCFFISLFLNFRFSSTNIHLNSETMFVRSSTGDIDQNNVSLCDKSFTVLLKLRYFSPLTMLTYHVVVSVFLCRNETFCNLLKLWNNYDFRQIFKD